MAKDTSYTAGNRHKAVKQSKGGQKDNRTNKEGTQVPNSSGMRLAQGYMFWVHHLVFFLETVLQVT